MKGIGECKAKSDEESHWKLNCICDIAMTFYIVCLKHKPSRTTISCFQMLFMTLLHSFSWTYKNLLFNFNLLVYMFTHRYIHIFFFFKSEPVCLCFSWLMKGVLPYHPVISFDWVFYKADFTHFMFLPVLIVLLQLYCQLYMHLVVFFFYLCFSNNSHIGPLYHLCHFLCLFVYVCTLNQCK